MLQVLEAVKHMHDQRVIHRDFKLEMFYLMLIWKLKLPILVLLHDLKIIMNEEEHYVVHTNYIAPEILDRGDKGHSYEVDIWSIGVIL